MKEKNPLLSDLVKILPSEEIKRKVGSELFKEALAGSRKVNAYRFLYESNGNKVVGFIVEPKKKKSKHPCIIWNRGGSRDFGSIKQGQLFLRLAKFAKEGYIVIASNYSGSPGSEGVDDWGGENINDVLVLKKILQKWPGADVSKIGMYGWSRGGMMTYRALSLVKWIKVAVIGAAPTDEVSAPKFRDDWREHQISLYGPSKAEQIKRSALYWPEKIYKKAPILLLHGSADWRVQVTDSIRMAEKLYAQKVPYRLVVFEGGDHGLTEFAEEVDKLEIEWFGRFLKNGEKLPNLKHHGV